MESGECRASIHRLLHVDALNVLRFQSFIALDDFKMDDFSFVESLEPVAVDCRVMHENIGSGFLLKDKPKSLFIVEPFYLPAGHRTPVSRYCF